MLATSAIEISEFSRLASAAQIERTATFRSVVEDFSPESFAAAMTRDAEAFTDAVSQDMEKSSNR